MEIISNSHHHLMKVSVIEIDILREIEISYFSIPYCKLKRYTSNKLEILCNMSLEIECLKIASDQQVTHFSYQDVRLVYLTLGLSHTFPSSVIEIYKRNAQYRSFEVIISKWWSMCFPKTGIDSLSTLLCSLCIENEFHFRNLKYHSSFSNRICLSSF